MNQTTDLVIGLAAPADLDGILAVQEENQPEHGGSLSARFPRDWFVQAIDSQSIIVARRGDRIAGYVAFTPREMQAHIPIVQAMLQAYPGPSAYLHGPICVGRDFRRRGVATAMFEAQRAQMKHSDVIAFIREDNHASRRAHVGMGLHEAATFEHSGVRYVVLASAAKA